MKTDALWHISDRITSLQIFLKLLAFDVAVVAHPEDKIASVGTGDLPQTVDTDARILGCFLEVENCFFPYRDIDHIIFGLGGFLLSMYRMKFGKGAVVQQPLSASWQIAKRFVLKHKRRYLFRDVSIISLGTTPRHICIELYREVLFRYKPSLYAYTEQLNPLIWNPICKLLLVISLYLLLLE